MIKKKDTRRNIGVSAELYKEIAKAAQKKETPIKWFVEKLLKVALKIK